MADIIKPTQTSDRIPSIDYLRGIAILGILFINIENFAYPDSWSPWKYGFENTIDRTTRFWVYFLTQGKFYSMFALLFGVGFYLFLERLEKTNLGLKAMDIYARRLLWLFVIGVMHAYLIWDGDILYHYAICGFLLFPFRSIKNQTLILIIVFLGLLQLVRAYEQTIRRQGWQEAYNEAINIPEDNRTLEDHNKIEFWINKNVKKAPDTAKVQIKKENYFTGLKETFEHESVHKGLLYYQGLLFSSLMLMIMGIVLYRSGIFKDYHAWKYYWFISLSILCLGLVINYFRYYQWTYNYYEPIVNIWQGWLYTFPRELLGIGYILILNGLYQKFIITLKSKIISNIGRMALSNYIFQNTLLGLIFYGYGLAYYNQFSRFELLGFVLIIWIVQIIFSWLWMIRYKQGPLEWVWKKLTYSGSLDQ